jgi:hypothetical protein
LLLLSYSIRYCKNFPIRIYLTFNFEEPLQISTFGGGGASGFGGGGGYSGVGVPNRNICQHFLKGTCRYGNNCRFSHAKPGTGKPFYFCFTYNLLLLLFSHCSDIALFN